MSTHGNLQIQQDGWGENRDETRSIWMHAYSDGHTVNLIEGLLSLPEWMAARSVWNDQEVQKRLDKDGKAIESSNWDICPLSSVHDIGPFWFNHLSIFKNNYITAEGNFISYDSILHINCHLPDFASYVSTRWWNRWLFVDERDCPYHTVGEPPDVRVTINQHGTGYVVTTDSVDDEQFPDGVNETVYFTSRVWNYFGDVLVETEGANP